VLQEVSVGLDLNLPGAPVWPGPAATWPPIRPARLQPGWPAGWVLRLLAWAFAALFIAGFTGAVRKT